MRRILNLNQSSLVFLKVIGLFIVVIPTILFFILLLLGEAENIAILIRHTIGISFAMGALVSVVFLVLIIAEQIQDHWIDIQYQKNRVQKIRLANGNYECQYCGNRKIKENDKTCSICGRALT